MTNKAIVLDANILIRAVLGKKASMWATGTKYTFPGLVIGG